MWCRSDGPTFSLSLGFIVNGFVGNGAGDGIEHGLDHLDDGRHLSHGHALDASEHDAQGAEGREHLFDRGEDFAVAVLGQPDHGEVERDQRFVKRQVALPVGAAQLAEDPLGGKPRPPLGGDLS